jgi:integrase
VTSADGLGFITAQRHGGDGRLQVVGDADGVSARSVRRRLSSVSGLFGYLHARGDLATNPVPRGLPTRRERQRPRQSVALIRATRTLPRILEPGEVDALLAALRTQRDRRWPPRTAPDGRAVCREGLEVRDLGNALPDARRCADRHRSILATTGAPSGFATTARRAGARHRSRADATDCDIFSAWRVVGCRSKLSWCCRR